MKNNINRCQAQFELDELLEAQKNGQNVTQQQIREADQAWSDAANRENRAELNARLYAVGADFETLCEQRKKARDAMRALLHKQDALRELAKK